MRWISRSARQVEFRLALALASLGAPCATALGQAEATEPPPLLRAHSHNDYLRIRPLEDALAAGFFSVEVDLCVQEGELRVAHEHATARAGRTFETLYLSPLASRARSRHGRVYADGPLGFRLLVDLKDPPEATWPLLAPILARYADVLSSWQDGILTERAIRIVLSGNKPTVDVRQERLRYCAIDGGATDEDAALFPLCSEPWTKRFTWNGQGDMPKGELAQLRVLVRKVHGQGRKLRFWRLPAKERVWQTVFDAGVDVLHTDDIRGLRAFLGARRLPKWPEGWSVEDRAGPEAGESAIELARFVRTDPPLRAVAVRIDLASCRHRLKPVVAQTTRREAKCSELAASTDAVALINAGFFTWEDHGLEPRGAFVVDGNVVQSPKTDVASKGGARFAIARAALLLEDASAPSLAWLSCPPAIESIATTRPGAEEQAFPNGAWLAFATPFAHTASAPASTVPLVRRIEIPKNAIGAGPMLLRHGTNVVRASCLGERLFVKDKRHPRTAVGLRGNVVWLLTVDGRQPESVGVTLEELASILRELGATDALTFDGGGSTTLVWKGRVANHPSEGGVERKVPTALGLFRRDV
ncbi:MAG: phosphodiester glycosidase family protein [Planctomycetes bacterium]|nr:phosphodiester glycosidase family protein [Planctomycetota bacterium]